MFGFFDSPSEFTESNVRVIEQHCEKTGGYCYVPPKTLEKIRFTSSRFRSNIMFGQDMLHFTRKGMLP